MSTLSVSNITDGTTTVGTSYVVNGAAKAWCCWNGTGTAEIRDSLNVSGFVDNNQGDYTFSYTSDFGSDDYQIGGQFAYSSVITTYAYNVQPRENSAVTEGSARLITVYVGSSTSGLLDYPYAAFNAHGDLA